MISLGWEHLWLTEHIIRKTAHFAEYAVLGGLMVKACGENGRYRIFNRDVLTMIFMVPLWMRPFSSLWQGGPAR